jgi:hypothetical protein
MGILPAQPVIFVKVQQLVIKVNAGVLPLTEIFLLWHNIYLC